MTASRAPRRWTTHWQPRSPTALKGIDIEADEQALIRLHQFGGIDHVEFLRRATALAQRKSGTGDA